ncbi:MAG: DUF429 domain-containing protein [Limnobacter sp.]|nr:DUF429 domain-containing protein [Limnobacter sp.]
MIPNPHQLIGIDFSSSPSRKRPITVATAEWEGQTLRLQSLKKLPKLEEFDELLAKPEPFLAAIDMPFGLSRQLVDGLAWPGAQRQDVQAWADLITFYGKLSKEEIRATFKAWCDARPPGQKFAHRKSDKPAGASPSMKWVNPPVAFMLREGAPRLLRANLTIPGMHEGDPNRVALEAYPGYLARQVLGRQSYKTDTPSKDSADRQMARSELVCAMEEGMLLGTRLSIPKWLRAELLLDPKADYLDAALCVLVAASCSRQAGRYFGLPAQIDPVEGWIAGVPWK